MCLKISDISSEGIVIKQSEFGAVKCVPMLSLLKPYLTVYLNGYHQHKSAFLFTDKFGKPLKTSTVFKVLKLVAEQIHFPEMYLFVLR